MTVSLTSDIRVLLSRTVASLLFSRSHRYNAFLQQSLLVFYGEISHHNDFEDMVRKALSQQYLKITCNSRIERSIREGFQNKYPNIAGMSQISQIANLRISNMIFWSVICDPTYAFIQVTQISSHPLCLLFNQLFKWVQI